LESAGLGKAHNQQNTDITKHKTKNTHNDHSAIAARPGNLSVEKRTPFFSFSCAAGVVTTHTHTHKPTTTTTALYGGDGSEDADQQEQGRQGGRASEGKFKHTKKKETVRRKEGKGGREVGRERGRAVFAVDSVSASPFSFASFLPIFFHLRSSFSVVKKSPKGLFVFDVHTRGGRHCWETHLRQVRLPQLLAAQVCSSVDILASLCFFFLCVPASFSFSQL
jgi:hypothetical protein